MFTSEPRQNQVRLSNIRRSATSQPQTAKQQSASDRSNSDGSGTESGQGRSWLEVGSPRWLMERTTIAPHRPCPFPPHQSVNGCWKETDGTKRAKRRYELPCSLSYPDTWLAICRSLSSFGRMKPMHARYDFIRIPRCMAALSHVLCFPILRGLLLQLANPRLP